MLCCLNSSVYGMLNHSWLLLIILCSLDKIVYFICLLLWHTSHLARNFLSDLAWIWCFSYFWWLCPNNWCVSVQPCLKFYCRSYLPYEIRFSRGFLCSEKFTLFSFLNVSIDRNWHELYGHAWLSALCFVVLLITGEHG